MEKISTDQVLVKLNVPNWQQAVRETGRLLVAGGFAEERYIEGMVNLSQELGPYIVLTPGVAIPHARPEEGAIKVGFAVVTLDPPINFGNEYNDPVHLVIGFCSPGADAHVGMITHIARLLGVEGFLEKCKSANTPQDLADVFNQTTY